MKFLINILLLLISFCSNGQNDDCRGFVNNTECVIWECNDTILLFLYFPQTGYQIPLDTLHWYNRRYMMSKHDDTLSLYKVKRKNKCQFDGKRVEYKIKRHIVYKGDSKILDYWHWGNRAIIKASRKEEKNSKKSQKSL